MDRVNPLTVAAAIVLAVAGWVVVHRHVDPEWTPTDDQSYRWLTSWERRRRRT